MRIFVPLVWILHVVAVLGACGCSGAQGLVGLWQTETVRITVANRTNILESYETVEFLKDGSFKMASTIGTGGDKRTGVVFSGTYTLIDTNHIHLEVASNQARTSDKLPLTVRFSIIGSELEMERLIPSVVPETQKYRRVKR